MTDTGTQAPSGLPTIISSMGSALGFDGIADFRFVRFLGSGGFANTYEAEREDERFAVKVLHEPFLEPRAAERFKREVLSLRIPHPNLAEYVDSGIAEQGGRRLPYIAMRYVEGHSLKQHLELRGGRLPWPEAVEIARGLATGLACLHDNGTVHRDLKPGNGYIPSAGGVLILDFGLASMLDLTAITGHGEILGTPAYCAPEQIRGETDIHTDLYALGVTLFQMLTGRVPFESTNHLELIERIRTEEPEPPSALEASVPPWLDRLVLTLLAKEPLQRPRNAQAVLDAMVPENRVRAPVRPAHDRSSAPLLAVRTTTKSAARAVIDAAMQGDQPDFAVAPITGAGQLEELHRARGIGRTKLAVDTRVLDTATAGYRSLASLRDRAFLPAGPEPHTPASLRASGETNRVARGDMREQVDEGADLLRATAFAIDAGDHEWLQRNARLLDSALSARAALGPTKDLWAVVPCTIEALTHADGRVSIINRFARGEPDGYWLGVAGVESSSADQIAGAVHFALMLQQLGAPCMWTLPGPLAELAWSMGVAGVEVALGRVGGFRLPSPTRQVRRRPPAPRFELPSLMTSLDVDTALELLASGALPESDCACPSCRAAATPAERVAHADDHNLWTWLRLRDELGRIDADARLERYELRLVSVADRLATVGRRFPKLRWLRSHVQLLEDAVVVAKDEGVLDEPVPLRRAS